MFKLFSWSSLKMINSLKTAIACLFGYLLVLLTPLPQSQWIVITIIVVMSAQTTVGSLFIKAQMRFWGTILGALAALMVILVCNHNPIAIGIALFVFSLLFVYIASTPGDVSYIGTLGAVTLVIIILTPNVTVLLALERFLEILLGILISFIASYFIWPVRSHTLFLTNLKNTLVGFEAYFNHIFDDLTIELNLPLYTLGEKIFSNFAKQDRFIYEIGHELGKTRRNKKNLQKILDTERKVYRGLNLVYYTLQTTPETRDVIQNLNGFVEFKTAVSNYLQKLASNNKVHSKMNGVELKDFKLIMQKDFVKQATNLDHLQISNVHAFLFSVGFLLKELKQLHTLMTYL